MPKRIMKFKKDHVDHTVELSWGMFFKNFTVIFDGIEVGKFENQKDLNNGRDFILKNGDVLRVKKTQKIFTLYIEVLLNGAPIEGSDSDPTTVVINAYKISMFLCGLNLLVGTLASFFKIEFLLRLGFGWYNIVIFFLYFIPIFIGHKNRSWIALCFVLAVFLLDTVFGFLWLIELSKQGYPSNGGAMVARLFFGVPIFLGAKEAFFLREK